MMKLIERYDYMKRLRELRDHHLIKVVTGVRRCGKSTLMEMFADELAASGVSKEQIQQYNFEDPDVYTIGDWKQIYDHIKARLNPNKMNYLFLDEVQSIDAFERLVDGLYIKKNCDVYVTGSNALLLSGELATLLTGRYIEIGIQPFSYSEYSRALAVLEGGNNLQGLAESADHPGSSVTQNLVSGDRLLVRYLLDGGMPQAVQLRQTTSAADEFLRGVISTIVEKDIFQRHEILHKQSFNKLVDFTCDSVGSLISSASISNTLKSEGITIDRKTVAKYLDYLSTAYLFYKVHRFDVKGKNLLRTQEKYYLSDTGFRRARLRREAQVDIGHLLENAVYLELRRRYQEVFVGKWNEYEIDFVAVDPQGYTSYFQVALTTLDEKTLERELRPLRTIRDSNQKYLLTTDIDGDPVYDGIRKLNVADWLLG